jgi:hypothetical protein
MHFIQKIVPIIFSILFIFAIGAVYALLRPEDLIIHIVFLIIVIGWIIFVIKLIWDLIEGDKFS